MFVNLLWQDFSFCGHISIKLNSTGHMEILMDMSKSHAVFACAVVVNVSTALNNVLS